MRTSVNHNLPKSITIEQNQAAMGVLKNTYLLLSATLAFSGLIAFLTMNISRPNIMIFLLGAYGLMFVTHKLANSAWGILSIFAFTGFMGYSIGPIIGSYVGAGAGEIVSYAMFLTAAVFLSLSSFALISKKDFSFLSGFLLAGFVVLLGSVLVTLLFSISGHGVAISAGFVLFSSGAILYETGQIVHGGQRNYILATISLYVSIYNLLLSLMSLLGASRD